MDFHILQIFCIKKKLKMIFWGLNMEPNSEYAKPVGCPLICISQIALDDCSADEYGNQIFINQDNQRYLICTLDRNKCKQVQINLNLGADDDLSITNLGSGKVTLTGYFINEASEPPIRVDKSEIKDPTIGNVEKIKSASIIFRTEQLSVKMSAADIKAENSNISLAVKDEEIEEDLARNSSAIKRSPSVTFEETKLNNQKIAAFEIENKSPLKKNSIKSQNPNGVSEAKDRNSVKVTNLGRPSVPKASGNKGKDAVQTSPFHDRKQPQRISNARNKNNTAAKNIKTSEKNRKSS